MLWLNLLILCAAFSAVCTAEFAYADGFIDAGGARSFIEDFAATVSAASSEPISRDLYARLRSFKVAAFYHAADELDRRITEIIRTEVSEQYAEAWVNEKFGFVRGSLPKVLALQNVADDKMIQTVCETGFNVGYGVLNVLIANPTASIVSFDIFMNRYSAYAVRALHDMFPHRDITVVAGDSSVSVPNFFRKVGANTVCDMAFVDSGGPEVRGRDIVNLAPHMNYNRRTRPGTVAPVPKMVLQGLRIVADSAAPAADIIEPALLNREFSHVLLVDDLHTPELAGIYNEYVDRGAIVTLDHFEVVNTPCMRYEYVIDGVVDYYEFDKDYCSLHMPGYVDPGFVDSVFVKSMYLR